MKSSITLNAIVVLLFAVLAHPAMAQSDDDQVCPPSAPIPKGEIALDQLQEVKLKENSVFTTYIEGREMKGNTSLQTSSVSGAGVPCSLTTNNVNMSNFREVTRETVGGGSGFRFYASPKSSITLTQTMNSVGVEEVKPSCNGEPELCTEMPHYEYRTIITLADKNRNEWKLSCLANFSRELYVSDVQIQGVKIK